MDYSVFVKIWINSLSGLVVFHENTNDYSRICKTQKYNEGENGRGGENESLSFFFKLNEREKEKNNNNHIEQKTQTLLTTEKLVLDVRSC